LKFSSFFLCLSRFIDISGSEVSEADPDSAVSLTIAGNVNRFERIGHSGDGGAISHPEAAPPHTPRDRGHLEATARNHTSFNPSPSVSGELATLPLPLHRWTTDILPPSTARFCFGFFKFSAGRFRNLPARKIEKIGTTSSQLGMLNKRRKYGLP
jgi:hypothetical protein